MSVFVVVFFPGMGKWMSSASDQDVREAWRALHSASLWRVPYGDLAFILWRLPGGGEGYLGNPPTVANIDVVHRGIGYKTSDRK